MLILRRATINDASLLFGWRNDIVTRTNFINQDPVPWEVHVDWLARTLANPDRLLFVGADGQPVGTSRLDICTTLAELSYTIAPEHRRKGYGHALVRETVKHSAIPIKATVKRQNTASCRILEAADFSTTGEEDDLLVYVRP